MSSLSIITATLNSSSRISSLAETIQNIELNLPDPSLLQWVVQDNVSTDGTLETVLRYVPNASVFSEPDRSIFDAWNKALLRARGEWILFLGDDDLVSYEYVNEILSCKASQDSVICTSAELRDSRGRLCGFSRPPKKRYLPVRSNNFCHPAIAFPAKLFIGLEFDISYKAISDMLFYYRYTGLRVKIANTKHGVTMCTSGLTGSPEGVLLILSEYLHAVYYRKAKLNLPFFIRKALIILVLQIPSLYATLKRLRWGIPFNL